MKKIVLAVAFMLTALTAFTQNYPDYVRTKKTGNQNVVDARLKAYLNLSIPKGATFTLNGAKDTAGYIMFNTTINKMGIYVGGGIWDTIGATGFSIETDPVLYAQKGQINGVATLDADGKITLTQRPAETDPVFLSQKAQPNGVATLNANGKIPNGQIPALALTEPFVVGSQAEMLGLTDAEQGDVAIRTDVNKNYILSNNNPSNIGSWVQLLSPVIPVEADPVFAASPAYSITSPNIANWMAAYGWGNHSGLYVDLVSNQTASGQKNWLSDHLYAANSDQYIRMNNTSVARKGLLLSNDVNIALKLYAGGNATLGAFTEASNVLVYGTGYQGGGAGAEVHLWHSTGKGNIFSMNAANSTNTSYFQLYAPSFKVPSGLATQFLKADGSLDATSYYKLNDSPQFASGTFTNGLTVNLPNGVSGKALTVARSAGQYAYHLGLDAALSNFYIYDNNGTTPVFGIVQATKRWRNPSLSGGGDRLVMVDNNGDNIALGIGSGLSISSGNLIATGGSSGSMTGSGTAGYLPKFTGGSALGNSLIQETGGTLRFNGPIAGVGTLMLYGNQSSSTVGLGIATNGDVTAPTKLLLTTPPVSTSSNYSVLVRDNSSTEVKAVSVDLSQPYLFNISISDPGGNTMLTFPHGKSGITSNSVCLLTPRSYHYEAVRYVETDATNIYVHLFAPSTSGGFSYSVSLKP